MGNHETQFPLLEKQWNDIIETAVYDDDTAVNMTDELIKVMRANGATSEDVRLWQDKLQDAYVVRVAERILEEENND